MRAIAIAKTLVNERHKKGISQEELARYMGVSKAAVSKWENEQSFPDIMLLPELATFFNISIDELMGYQPQMTKEEIRRHYFSFAEAFEEEEFELVFQRCQEMIRKYYSCYPFLLQMAVLLLNHANSSSNPQQMMEYTIALLQKVEKESENPDDVKDAISVEASCYLLMNQPQDALELVSEQVRPLSQETELLAQIYQQMGNVERAKEVFDRIESWFREFELGQMPPRGEKFIKQSMIQAMCDNPGFAILKTNPEFQKLEKRLKRSVEQQ